MLQSRIGIGRIENYAFANCTSLENINIPNSVEGYGMGIFENCSRLKTIEIPNGVMGESNPLFEGCSSMENIYVREDASEWRNV